MRSIHAACLDSGRPEEGHVLLVEPPEASGLLSPGGYALVSHLGEDVLLNSIRLSRRGELEYGDRLVRAPYAVLSSEMIVGWETMIIPE